MPEKTYRGTTIDVLYDARRCIHAAECVRRLPAVFDPQARPWIRVDAADAAEVAAAVRQCPSGALHYREHHAEEGEMPQAAAAIELRANGPYYLRGDLQLTLADGARRETRAALCRCGQSQNKPFCDNSHRQANFQAEGGATATPAASARGGELVISPQPNGPLVLQGECTICLPGDDGETLIEKGALCRCGASAAKPFCDGSHVRVGFRSE